MWLLENLKVHIWLTFVQHGSVRPSSLTAYNTLLFPENSRKFSQVSSIPPSPPVSVSLEPLGGMLSPTRRRKGMLRRIQDKQQVLDGGWNHPGEGQEYWMLKILAVSWRTFQDPFLSLWLLALDSCLCSWVTQLSCGWWSLRSQIFPSLPSTRSRLQTQMHSSGQLIGLKHSVLLMTWPCPEFAPVNVALTWEPRVDAGWKEGYKISDLLILMRQRRI